jgi:KDO2-lipid IV(A) lauroyltransferase
MVPSARRAVQQNLLRIRGPVSPSRDAAEVLATFAHYASCFAEALSNDTETGAHAVEATVLGDEHVYAALEKKCGLVLVTAHTAGWDIVGPLLARATARPTLLVMEKERDAGAREIQDGARKRSGVGIVHVGDPLAALPLLRHLRHGGIVALQFDRVAKGMRTRKVPLLGGQGEVPEGPLRLAQLSGAPIVPVFSTRTGFRRYAVEVFEPIVIERSAGDAELDRAATVLATSMTAFLRAHPTQWFHFH